MFVAVAVFSVVIFEFVAVAVLCFVLAAVLVRAGWLSPSGWIRPLCWLCGAALIAIPILMFLEVGLSYQISTVS